MKNTAIKSPTSATLNTVSKIFALLAIANLAPAAGCDAQIEPGDEDPSLEAEENHEIEALNSAGVPVVATVRLPGDVTVDFLEPEPGYVFLSERGPARGTPVLAELDTPNLEPLDVYELITDGDEPPAALVRAHETATTPLEMALEAQDDAPFARARLQLEEEDASDQQATRLMVHGPGTSSGDCSKNWAKNNLVGCQFDYDAETHNFNATGQVNIYGWGARQHHTSVCPYKNNIRFRYYWKANINKSWSELLDEPVHEDNYHQVIHTKSVNDFHSRSRVSQASGDYYQHCVGVYD